eukprot:TRINITY_DN9024_c0_g1_i3.p1 TRINITY_DN9024_c0_g1~~TRINITY_DN9024_c0_g1_i3.p1  ORF type:complete len:404 (-),score=44.26 TRINITY_DN9024_c0_g1_i3:309-1520(-)
MQINSVGFFTKNLSFQLGDWRDQKLAPYGLFATLGFRSKISYVELVPQWNRSTAVGDLAVLVLNESLPGPYLQVQRQQIDPEKQPTLMVAGWGATNPAEKSFRIYNMRQLYQDDIVYIDSDMCKSFLNDYDKLVNNYVNTSQFLDYDTMFCAVSLSRNGDTCAGDSGSPVVREGNNPDHQLRPLNDRQVAKEVVWLIIQLRQGQMSKQAKHGLSILDRPLTKYRTEVPTVNLSAFAILFGELIQYSLDIVQSQKGSTISDLEHRLKVLGYDVGVRVLELMSYREPSSRYKRHLKLIDALKYIHSFMWPYLFGKQADDLQQSQDVYNQYMIYDYNLLTNKFISVPKEWSSFNPGSFVAGIIQGYLDAAGFATEEVSAFSNAEVQSIFVIKFTAETVAREGTPQT